MIRSTRPCNATASSEEQNASCYPGYIMRSSQAILEAEMRQKYEYKKKLMAAKARRSAETANQVPMIVWIMPIVIAIVIFAAWIVWMLLKIENKVESLKVTQPLYYVATQPTYYPTE